MAENNRINDKQIEYVEFEHSTEDQRLISNILRMPIIGWKGVSKKYIRESLDENFSYADIYLFNFMQEVINTSKDQSDQIAELQGKVKRLEQEGSYFDRVENIKIGGTD